MTNKIFKSIGMMSGTSLDGIDAAIVFTDGYEVLEFSKTIYLPYENSFKEKVKSLICGDLSNVKEVEKELTVLHFEASKKLIDSANLKFNDIDLIGFHGQSIAHDPANKMTHQIGDGKLLAKMTGINVVNDFRTNDVKNGGQGAPLVPIFLKALNEKLNKDLFLNIGGVSNICFVERNNLIAFDTGFGNAPINDLIENKLGLPFDNNGDIARTGKVDVEIANLFMHNDFFHKDFPKSLDRNHFNFTNFANMKIEDALATMVEIIAKSVDVAIKQVNASKKEIIVSGGGARNSYLVERIEKVANIKVLRLEDFNMSGDFLEAQAFAYLAVRSALKLPISFPQTTGVKQPLVGGVFCHA